MDSNGVSIEKGTGDGKASRTVDRNVRVTSSPGQTHLISEDSMKIRVRIEPKGTRYRKTGRTYFAKMTSVVNQQTFRSQTQKIFRLATWCWGKWLSAF